jgi:hypothetical protein
MALLSAARYLEVRARVMRLWSDRREGCAITKPVLLAAIQAFDGYIDTNASAINTSLAPAARTGLTAQQKSELFAAVALERYGVDSGA